MHNKMISIEERLRGGALEETKYAVGGKSEK